MELLSLQEVVHRTHDGESDDTSVPAPQVQHPEPDYGDTGDDDEAAVVGAASGMSVRRIGWLSAFGVVCVMYIIFIYIVVAQMSRLK